MRGFSKRGGGIWVVLLLVGLGTSPATAQDPVDFFRRNCLSCHTIGGGRLTGPDLKNVESRKDRDWLAAFMVNPKAKLDRGDPYALQLRDEARGVIMPSLPGLNPTLARSLLDMIATESQLEVSQFTGLQITDLPFTPQDLARGRDYFLGSRRLQNGGAACLSCHTVKGLGSLSGGRLGPDLTLVFERLQGRRALSQWLLAPATTTMQPLFGPQPLTPEEIIALTAYLEETARRGGQDQSTASLNFFLIGLGGALFGLVLLDQAWKRRFRAVRRPQVKVAELKSDPHL